MTPTEFHNTARSFGDEATAQALDKLYAKATDKEKEKLSAAVQDWANNHNNTDGHVRDRSLSADNLAAHGIVPRAMEVAKAHSDDKLVQDAMITLTGDKDAGRKLEEAGKKVKTAGDTPSFVQDSMTQGKDANKIMDARKLREDASKTFDELAGEMTTKFRNAGKKLAPAEVAVPKPVTRDTSKDIVVDAPATRPAPAYAPSTPGHASEHEKKGYVTKVAIKGGGSISAADLQIALKQMGEEKTLGNHGINGVDGKAGGKTVEAFNHQFRKDGQNKVASPGALELTQEEAAQVRAKVEEFKAQHPDEYKKIQDGLKHGGGHHQQQAKKPEGAALGPYSPPAAKPDVYGHSDDVKGPTAAATSPAATAAETAKDAEAARKAAEAKAAADAERKAHPPMQDGKGHTYKIEAKELFPEHSQEAVQRLVQMTGGAKDGEIIGEAEFKKRYDYAIKTAKEATGPLSGPALSIRTSQDNQINELFGKVETDKDFARKMENYRPKDPNQAKIETIAPSIKNFEHIKVTPDVAAKASMEEIAKELKIAGVKTDTDVVVDAKKKGELDKMVKELYLDRHPEKGGRGGLSGITISDMVTDLADVTVVRNPRRDTYLPVSVTPDKPGRSGGH